VAQELSKFVVNDVDDVEDINEGQDTAQVEATAAVEPASREAHEKDELEGSDSNSDSNSVSRDDPASTPAGPPPLAESAPTRGRGSRALVGILLVLLAVAGLAVWGQTERARSLEAQVGVLRQELASAQIELSRHQSRMDQVRMEVTDLLGRVEALNALVSDEPGSPVAPATFD
jgi:hypothetical protein